MNEKDDLTEFFGQCARIRYLMIFGELILLGIAQFHNNSLSEDYLNQIFAKN